MNYYCYANGNILRKNKIKVGIYDLVMIRGYGVFDYLRTYSGLPFCTDDYIDRFENSVKEMQLKLPVSRNKIKKIIALLLKKNYKKGKDLGIRFLLTGGYSLDAYLPAKTPNFFILIEDLPAYPAWWSDKGIKLMLHDHKRELAVVKTTNYITAINLANERRKHNAQDTLYTSNGKVLETTRNNFFLFHGNTLVTAKKDVLNGVTRKVILELARKNFKVEVREVSLKELKSCTECFISGTTRGVTPVVQIGDTKIGNGKPGVNTIKLMKAFEKRTNSDPEL